MKKITINQIRLLNFKGIRDLEIKFDAESTVISGRNGTGKTSVFDAFTWLLFGKDSKDREKFDYKTIDKDGVIIPRIPHEVSAILTVDGERISLTRRIVEKWVKRSGEVEEIYTGNETERLYNDVPCSDAEFKLKIAEICPESVFKQITNPSYFCSQKADVQKRILTTMAGEISDSEIAAGNSDFEEYLRLISGKTAEEFKKEINAKKSRLKSELDDIPGRIDEKKRGIPADENWEEIESQITEKTRRLDEIESLILDKAERNKGADEALRIVYDRISELRMLISKREVEISNEANKDYDAKIDEWNELHRKMLEMQSSVKRIENDIYIKSQEVSRLSSQRIALLDQWKQINANIAEIRSRQLVFKDSDFRCPTCNRVFEDEDIEAKRIELQVSFDERIRRDKDVQEQAKNENLAAGQALRTKLDAINAEIAKLTADKQAVETQCSVLAADPKYVNKIQRRDVSQTFDGDARILAYREEMTTLKTKAEKPAPKEDITELSAERKRLFFELDGLKIALSKRETIARDNDRIKELESQYATLSQSFAELQRMEFIMAEFSKAKNEEVQRRIDSLFDVVKFRWIAVQINGAEKETCEATVNGVPYSVLNHAGQIDAGLDIINAICRSQGISAPIFIDNAESCNAFRDTVGQQILLEVSNDKTLKIISK